MKKLAAKLYILLGWLAFFEEGQCDVVAWKCRANGRIRMIGIELERSMRNLIHNLTRDFAQGCGVVLIVVPDEALRGAARRKIERFAPEVRMRVGITTINRIEEAIARLEKRNAN